MMFAMWKRIPTATRQCLQNSLDIRKSSRNPEVSGSVLRQEGCMPTPRRLPFIGTTLSIIAAGSAPKLHEYVDSRHRQLGPVYQETIGHLNAVFVADAEDMRRIFALEGKYPRHLQPDAWVLYNEIYGCKRGLFFMDGDEWLTYRRIMNELLMKADSGRALLSPCSQAANDLVSRWRSQSGSEVINLEAEMYLWSTNNMMAVLMGTSKYLQHKEYLDEAIPDFAAGFHKILEKSVCLALFPPKLAAALHLPAWTSFVDVVTESLNNVNSLILKIIPDCKISDGLLGRMIDGGMQQEYISRIIADLILAAGDTSAFALQWILYTLCQNPEIQEELHEELKTLNDSDEIMRSSLLKNCIRETMRLYPVAPFILRYLPSECVIGGYNVPADQLIMLSIYTTGRDEKYFPNASAFWPHRWSRSGNGQYIGVKSPYASLPFAMGARSCVGRKIAEAELMITTAKLLKQFKIELIDTQPVDMVLRFVSVPSKPIRLRITERSMK